MIVTRILLPMNGSAAPPVKPGFSADFVPAGPTITLALALLHTTAAARPSHTHTMNKMRGDCGVQK